jgi:sialate O-acetylesterase
MIKDWRRAWNEGDFPFLLVQIANWNTEPDGRWPEVRDAQRKTLALRNTGMAVTIDIGDAIDIHPKNKLDVGLRLARAARAITYGEKLEWSGPLYRQLTREDHALRVWFDHAAGLAAKGGPLVGFEVAGADGKYVTADAKIDGSSVIISSATVPEPVSVRYAWAPNPTCNLYNREGLPASPFQAPE